MSLDAALQKALEPLNVDIAKLREQISVLNSRSNHQAMQIGALEVAVFDEDEPVDDTEPDPGTPVPNPGTRRFGCNIGYQSHKDWSPDKPDHPDYAKIIAPFGCYRFMDWWQTNNDLNTGGRMTQAQIELLDRQIDLCNANGADMYLCLLFHDNDDTIFYKVARCRDRLHHRLYVEWINEPWNLGTNVSKEIQRISGVPSFGGGANLAFFDVWAAYASIAFHVAKDAYPGCVTVLGCLTANPWVAEKVEERLTTKPDAHGLTFYFGSGLGGTPDPNTTVRDIIDAAHDKIIDKEIPRIDAHAAYSKSIGRRIVGYEGGPHFTIDPRLHTSHRGVWKAMNQANRDPGIIPLCNLVAATAEQAGYEVLCWFNLCTLYDQWGSWGLVESLDDLSTPKYRYAAGIS